MNITFKKYFNNHNGFYVAFEKNRTKILILNKSQEVVKEVFISESIENIDLNFESLFENHQNKHGLLTELSIVENGYGAKDWLFSSHHVFNL